MDYEIAKKLLDAGFTMKKAIKGSQFIWGGEDTHGTYYEYPDLTDLIEALNIDDDTLFSLSTEPKSISNKRPERWLAAFGNKSFFLLNCFGDTPEEAVANLWLAINKKPT
jgi:hypothetical protein